MSTLLTLSLLACAPPDGLYGVLSPSDGAVIEVPWVPLLVRVDREVARAGRVEVVIDGQPWSDPLALMSNRYSWWGGDADFLATLDVWDWAPGLHELQVDVIAPSGRRKRRLNTTFEVSPPACLLHLTTVDQHGRPVPARVMVRATEGWLDLAGPDAELVDLRARDLPLYTLFTPGGRRSVRLPCGELEVLAARGPRDQVELAPIRLEGEQSLTLHVGRAVHTPGWLAADLHVHTGRSGDSFLPDRPRFESLAAVALDAVVLSDHDLAVDPRPGLAAVGAAGILGIQGIEAGMSHQDGPDDTDSHGHLNAFPFAPGDVAPERVMDDVAARLDAWRDRAGEEPPLLQLNHPRGIQFGFDEAPLYNAHALFNHFDWPTFTPVPVSGPMVTPAPGTGTTALDWDAIEIVNRFSWELYLQVRSDWFALWRAGWTITGTGNSDSHAIEVETAGLPINLIECPLPATTDCVVEALRAGRVTVSNGPIVSVSVTRGAVRVGPGGFVPGRGEVEVEVRVQAAPWVPVPELRLVVDGEVARRWSLADTPRPNGHLDTTRTWTFSPSADAFVLAEAGWPIEAPPPEDPQTLGLFARVAAGHLPLGFTNPVRVDGDDDGAWP